RSLAFQHLEEIAVIRLIAIGIAARNCGGDLFTNGTIPGAVGVLPRQAILLTRCADDSLRVLIQAVYFLGHGVIILCLDIAAADFDRVEFIPSYATLEQLLLSGFSVEIPMGGDLFYRDWKWPVFIADDQRGPGFGFVFVNPHFGACLSGEGVCQFFVTRRFARLRNVRTVRAK